MTGLQSATSILHDWHRGSLWKRACRLACFAHIAGCCCCCCCCLIKSILWTVTQCWLIEVYRVRRRIQESDQSTKNNQLQTFMKFHWKGRLQWINTPYLFVLVVHFVKPLFYHLLLILMLSSHFYRWRPLAGLTLTVKFSMVFMRPLCLFT